MNHWDMTPGETVQLAPYGEHEPEVVIELVFRWRDTRSAFFAVPKHPSELIQLERRTDGLLRDDAGKRWQILGDRADTRTVIEHPIGEGRFFTAAGRR